MKIEQDKWVAIHYTLKNDAGEELDSSVGGAPLGYVHGKGYLIFGLENELLDYETFRKRQVIQLVESTSSDFMDSVKDNTDETVSENLEEATFEETAMEEAIPLELPEDSLEETEAISENDDVPTVEKLLENENTEISFTMRPSENGR